MIKALFLITLFSACLCAEISLVEYGEHTVEIPENMTAVIDIYGQGASGFRNGTGGGSGAFVRAIVYGILQISINQSGIRLQSEALTAFVESGNGMFGGQYQVLGEVVTAQNGNNGEHKECVNGRCNISPCLKGCQGRQLSQQIIPGSGGLAPHHKSLDGTVMDNPIYEHNDRYIDEIYNTNLLNCCGDNIKCATQCVDGVNGSNGNGGSGALNFDGGSCDSIYYEATTCTPGNGGNPLVFISYEVDEIVNESDEGLMITMVILLCFCILFILFVISFILKSLIKRPSIQQPEV